MNNNKLFVGGLAWATTDDSLREFFSTVGNVTSANVISDRYTGKSKGFGFVEFSTPEEAKKAQEELNGKELDGRAINVSEARPQQPRENNFSGGGNFRRDNRGGDRRGGRDDRGRGGY